MMSHAQISDLADADLCAIFERLPPYDRLIASAICRRWHGLSRKAWLDVTTLDLSPIPGKHIGVIVRQCPNLRSVFALKNSFDLSELKCLSRASRLSAVMLYDCSFTVKGCADVCVRNEAFASVFSADVQHASWEELVLHDAYVVDANVVVCGNRLPSWAFSATSIPASLSRLQLSGLRLRFQDGSIDEHFLDAIDRLQNLECLILHTTPKPVDSGCSRELVHDALAYRSVYQKIRCLKNLRELCVNPAWPFTSPYNDFGRLVAHLPKLEVLFLGDVGRINGGHFAEDLKELIRKNSVLRILVLIGDPSSSTFFGGGPVWLPTRNRFPNGFGSAPLPLLRVFVGKQAAYLLRFATSSLDAAQIQIYPIDQPVPEFFEREDIAPIFEGVWVAQKFKDVAKNGGKFWEDGVKDVTSSCRVETLW